MHFIDDLLDLFDSFAIPMSLADKLHILYKMNKKLSLSDVSPLLTIADIVFLESRKLIYVDRDINPYGSTLEITNLGKWVVNFHQYIVLIVFLILIVIYLLCAG